MEVEIIVKSNKRIFSEIFYSRIVNNIYFDLFGFASFYDNIDGNTERKKYRIGWYGKLFGEITNPTFEIKYKKGLLGYKDQYKLNSFIMDKHFSNKTISHIIANSSIPKKIKFILKSLTPTLLNSYRRKYFQSSNKIYRITIDDNQGFYPIKNINNSFLQCFHDESVVLELKYKTIYDEGSEKVTNEFPFRLTKNSKYVNGINKLYGLQFCTINII